MKSEKNNLTLEDNLIFEMLYDQIAALQLSVAWLMKNTYPEESLDWLQAQITNCEKSPNLAEVAEGLKEIAGHLKEISQLK